MALSGQEPGLSSCDTHSLVQARRLSGVAEIIYLFQRISAVLLNLVKDVDNGSNRSTKPTVIHQNHVLQVKLTIADCKRFVSYY